MSKTSGSPKVKKSPGQSQLIYIPSNPFHSLADNIVPAVVLFSILVGVALLGVKEKSGLLRGLDIASEALGRVTKLIIRLSPLGLSAIVASASGTMSVEEFGRLQVYLLANAGVCDILTSGMTVTPQGAAQISFSASYRDETLAFVVPSHRRKEFRLRAAVRDQKGLRLGILSGQYYTARFREALP